MSVTGIDQTAIGGPVVISGFVSGVDPVSGPWSTGVYAEYVRTYGGGLRLAAINLGGKLIQCPDGLLPRGV